MGAGVKTRFKVEALVVSAFMLVAFLLLFLILQRDELPERIAYENTSASQLQYIVEKLVLLRLAKAGLAENPSAEVRADLSAQLASLEANRPKGLPDF